jgi:glycosyltransferase involved in cell wall biosynthesis
MKIGILTQWFDPEPGPPSLPGELARALVDRGHQVQVVTGFPNYPDGNVSTGYEIQRVRDEVSLGVRIRRVALYPSHGRSITGRLANYGSFGLSARAFGISEFYDCDSVWVYYSPVTVGFPLLPLRRKQVPIVLHVMDLWPDNIVSSGMLAPGRLASATESAVHAWNRRMYGLASRVLTISPGASALLESRGVLTEKLAYVPLWANESVFRPTDGTALRKEMGVSPSTVIIMYAGTLGGTQRVDRLIEAVASATRSGDDVACWIAGNGTAEEALRRQAEQTGLGQDRLRFLGRISMTLMPDYMAAADIHYVGLQDDALARVTMPSKVQATFASGKPILGSVFGDVDDLIRRTGAGVSATDQGLPAAIHMIARMGRVGLAEMGERARTTYDNEFSLRSGVTAVEKQLTLAIQDGGKP